MTRENRERESGHTGSVGSGVGGSFGRGRTSEVNTKKRKKKQNRGRAGVNCLNVLRLKGSDRDDRIVSFNDRFRRPIFCAKINHLLIKQKVCKRIEVKRRNEGEDKPLLRMINEDWTSTPVSVPSYRT
jgi:hypothetical protein